MVLYMNKIIQKSLLLFFFITFASTPCQGASQGWKQEYVQELGDQNSWNRSTLEEISQDIFEYFGALKEDDLNHRANLIQNDWCRGDGHRFNEFGGASNANLRSVIQFLIDQATLVAETLPLSDEEAASFNQNKAHALTLLAQF